MAAAWTNQEHCRHIVVRHRNETGYSGKMSRQTPCTNRLPHIAKSSDNILKNLAEPLCHNHTKIPDVALSD
ncbi:hypothetical protein KIN20_007633 [Parelaphostrongylus tenuis]|uniref:Uncharacterized protein n=1 Tax=Parelaphostrongylus tenuis TaxID=148309 RepID=A0AAD5MLN9_PARTN|nr:hypothetical protein KIN20_007633 [Parelaphostrongylus tenuis]